MAKLVIAPACQAGDRGFKPRRSRKLSLPLYLAVRIFPDGSFYLACSHPFHYTDHMKSVSSKISPDNFFTRLDNHRSSLTRRQIELATYIEQNFQESAFLSSVELGQRIGVSEATVIRLAQSLGYRGFLEMIKEIRSTFHDELSTASRMDRGKEESLDYRKSLLRDREALDILAGQLDRQTIDSITGLMHTAASIHLLGRESSFTAAVYAEYLFQHLRDGVSAIGQDNRSLISRLESADRHTLLFAFAFPRYPAETISITSMYKKRGASIVTISDSRLSPLQEFSSIPVIIPSNSYGIDYALPSIVLIRALFVEYGIRNSDQVRTVLDRREQFHKDRKTFYS